jgi:hypothetical protein
MKILAWSIGALSLVVILLAILWVGVSTVRQVNEPDPSTVSRSNVERQLLKWGVECHVAKIVYVNKDIQAYVVLASGLSGNPITCAGNPNVSCKWYLDTSSQGLLSVIKGKTIANIKSRREWLDKKWISQGGRTGETL